MKRFKLVQLFVIIGLLAFAIGAGAQERGVKEDEEGGRGAQVTSRIPYNSTGGPDLYGYQFFTNDSGLCNFSWILISNNVALDSGTTDDGSANVNLSMNFPFYGSLYSTANLTTNGFISFPNEVGGISDGDVSEDCPLPATPSTGIRGNPRIYTWHEDLDIDTGYLHTQYYADCPRNGALGSTTEPCTVLGWDAGYLGDISGNDWFMETILYQSGEIVNQYLGTNAPTNVSRRPTIGIQNGEYTSGLAASCGYDVAPNMNQNTAVCFRPVQAVPRTPVGLQTFPVTNLTWDVVTGEEWYHTVITNQSGFSYNQWHNAANVCGGSTCTVAAPNFVNGQYDFKLEYYQEARGTVLGAGSSTFMMSVPYPPSVNRVWPFDGSVQSVPVGRVQWAVNPLATWYNVIITNNTDSSTVLNKWFKGSDVCSGDFCYANIPVPPASGTTMTWKMRAWGPGGTGPENSTTFTHNFSAPAGFVGRVSPANGGNASAGNVNLIWPYSNDVVWYNLQLTGPLGFSHNQWYHVGNVCGATNCTVTLNLATGGSYNWTMQGWNPAGLGSTDVTSFTVN